MGEFNILVSHEELEDVFTACKRFGIQITSSTYWPKTHQNSLTILAYVPEIQKFILWYNNETLKRNVVIK